MKHFFIRCVALTLIFLLCLNTTAMADFLIKEVASNPWNMMYIFPEEEEVIPNIVIIYLHGDGNNGTQKLETLKVMGKVDHPLKYAMNDTLSLTDDTIFICPQSRGNGQFRYQQDELLRLIRDIKIQFPESIILLAGHSNGAIAADKVALSGCEAIDGYVFISGNQPAESPLLQFVSNAFVAYGESDTVARRKDFKALFVENDISLYEYSKKCAFEEKDSHNAYMVGKWTHGQAPRLFLEEFFWEWVWELQMNKEGI